ncbi:MAG TPA: ATP-dependent RecD-like DNA helicase, partial [Acidaminococcaceae bacterium]|nr:ATP-dependent RecD-like DNA helicase [Acidaminococcaceae bacterium]
MEKIEGTVETIVFQSDNQQFSVFRIRSAALGLVTAVYRGPSPFLGETVQASGNWTQHPRFGCQFVMAGYQSVKPNSAEGVERFLASGAVKGIGKAMAARIVEHFGRDTLEILGKAPERLAEISGIGAKKAKSIGEAYHAISDLREIMLFLEEHGVSGNYA